MSEARDIRFELDGEAVIEGSARPTSTLLEWLRATGRPATKEGCAEGDCGACTVAVADPASGAFRAVNSCLVLLPMVDGRQVWTAAGVGNSSAPHPVQEAMARHLGSQCGYCTPGFVMSMFEGVYRQDLDADWKLDDQLCGNLCRCTGYRPIRDAASELFGRRPDDEFAAALEATVAPLAELTYASGDQRFTRPPGLDHLFEAMAADPEARLICGGTDLSLEITKLHRHPASLISLEGIEELRELSVEGETIRIGAGVTLTDLEAACADALPAITRMLRFFGSRQIKHRATIGGNLCNASPIGDLAPVLLALDARVEVASSRGHRFFPIDEFFLGYRETALEAGEVLVAVEIPKPSPAARVSAYKVCKRREMDISAVAAGIRVETDADGLVTVARLGYGGVAATPIRARLTEAALIGKPWTEETVEDVVSTLDEDFSPLSDHRGTEWYRRTLMKNFLRGFWLETRETRQPSLPDRPVDAFGAAAEAGS